MRVLAATTAGAGHLAGLLPFARAVLEAGHEVRVAAPASFRDTVERAGFAHVPLADADPAALGGVFGRIPRLSMHEADDLVVSQVFGRLNRDAALPGMRAACARWCPDVVLREPAELASYVVATELDVPHVQTNIGLSAMDDRVLPLFDAALAELGCSTEGLRTGPRWTTVPQSFDQPALTRTGPLTYARAPATAAGPLPPQWSGDRDGPLVYATFGSVAADAGLFPDFYARVLDQLGQVPARVLLTLGAAADPAQLGPVPPNVHVERWWPQSAVLPRAAAVVCHGGFGTTQGALVAGVPQVVLPLFSFDQFLNAGRVAAVGVGIALADADAAERRAGDLLPRGPRATDGLAQAVVTVLGEPAFTAAARACAAEVEGLPAAGDCVPRLEALLR